MEAFYLLRNCLIGYDAVSNVRDFPPEKVDLPVHDPGRRRHPGKARRHQLSPNLFAITAHSASSAASASSPVARRVIVAPHSAASIITPMMLFAFTSRSSRTMVMLLLNFPAAFTISAAGRACMPSLLMIFASRSGIREGPSRVRTPRGLREQCATPPLVRASARAGEWQSRPRRRYHRRTP